MPKGVVKIGDPEKVVEVIKKKALSLVTLPPLAGAFTAALCWWLVWEKINYFPRLLGVLSPLFFIAGGVSACLFFVLGMISRNCLLRKVGVEVIKVISEKSDKKDSISASEAKKILERVGEVLRECERIKHVESKQLELAVAEISSLLKEADAVVGLAKDKVEKMIEVIDSVKPYISETNLKLEEEE